MVTLRRMSKFSTKSYIVLQEEQVKFDVILPSLCSSENHNYAGNVKSIHVVKYAI